MMDVWEEVGQDSSGLVAEETGDRWWEQTEKVTLLNSQLYLFISIIYWLSMILKHLSGWDDIIKDGQWNLEKTRHFKC